MFSKALLTSTLIAAVSAHQNWHQFWVNGETPGYQVGIRMPPSNSPVTDVTSNDIACNVNGAKVPSGVATVPAAEGDTIKVQWDQSGHPGPITHFLYGPVTDATMATGIGSWVKIDELDYVNGTWANAIMEANNMTHEFKLPTGLASGEYLLRSEMLALHGAQTVGGAQFYIGCAQLKITGTGGSCGPSIELPGAYKATDTNIYIPNVYNGFDPTNYTAPGGPVATCGASGSSKPVTTTAAAVPASNTTVAVSSAVAAPSTTAAAVSSVAAVSSAPAVSSAAAVSSARISFISSIQAAAPTSSAAAISSIAALPSTFATSVAPVSTAAASAVTSSVAGSVARYGQCGGANYKGATVCAEGATCQVQNPYYSQCV